MNPFVLLSLLLLRSFPSRFSSTFLSLFIYLFLSPISLCFSLSMSLFFSLSLSFSLSFSRMGFRGWVIGPAVSSNRRSWISKGCLLSSRLIAKEKAAIVVICKSRKFPFPARSPEKHLLQRVFFSRHLLDRSIERVGLAACCIHSASYRVGRIVKFSPPFATLILCDARCNVRIYVRASCYFTQVPSVFSAN